MSDIFKAKPRLSLPNEINLDSSSDEEMDTGETVPKKSSGLDNFMQVWKCVLCVKQNICENLIVTDMWRSIGKGVNILKSTPFPI